jgi:hypothetical protein
MMSINKVCVVVATGQWRLFGDKDTSVVNNKHVLEVLGLPLHVKTAAAKSSPKLEKSMGLESFK